MSLATAIIIGAVLGLLGTAPYAFVLRRVVREGPGGPDVAQGLICVIISTAIVSVGIALAHRLAPERFVAISTTASLTFLAAATAAVLVARRKINR